MWYSGSFRGVIHGAVIGVAPFSGAQAESCDGAKTQAAMNQCADQDFESADTALNAAYRQIIGRLRAQAKERQLLVAAQRSWLAYRDAECSFAASGVQGGHHLSNNSTGMPDRTHDVTHRRLAAISRLQGG
jgi:uncharacterized protein YecT (DUF1311 family)